MECKEMWCRIPNQAQKLQTPIHKNRGDDILEQKCFHADLPWQISPQNILFEIAKMKH